MPYPVAVPVALAAGVVLAMAVERVLIRPILAESHFATVLMTIGAFVALNSATQMVWGSTPRDIDTPFGGSFSLGEVRITANRVLSVGLAAVVAIALARFFRTSRGVRMRAVAEDRVTPGLLGVSLPWVFRTAWGAAGAIAALAMILQGQSTLVTDQNGGPISLKGFVAATVGGFTSVAGAFWAGLGAAGIALPAPKHGMTLVATEKLEPNSTDISSAVQKMKAKNPQAVISGTDNAQTALLLK